MREALRGASTYAISSCRAEDEPKSHIPGAAAGTEASLQVKVGTNLFLDCKRGLGVLDGEQACS